MIWKKRQKYNPRSGNAILMIFAAIGMAGVVAYGLNTIIRGPALSVAELSRKTIAENSLVAASRLAIAAAPAQNSGRGDCDGDGFIEPVQYRDPGTLPFPAGGGLIPAAIGASLVDPWGTQYGYCVWDAGTASVSDAVAACGGNTAKRLQGSPRDDQPAIAIISAGKNGSFETNCNAYADTNADNQPDTPLVQKAADSDDVVLSYSYAEANGIGGGLWKLKENDNTTAQLSKNLEVAGGANISGALKLGTRGLILPGDPGDNSVTGACAVSKDQQLRRNTSSSPPILEICDFSGSGNWVPVSGDTAKGCSISGISVVNSLSTGIRMGGHISGTHHYSVDDAACNMSVSDISTPAALSRIGYTNPSCQRMNRPVDVVTSGNYAFTANSMGLGITTVDVTNPMAPIIIGPANNSTLANPIMAVPSALALISNDYLAVTGSAANSLTIVNISNPIMPVIANSGTAHVTDGTRLGSPRDIAIKNGYAYIAAYSSNALTVVDVNNPNSPSIVGFLSNGTYLSQPVSVAISGNYALVGTNSRWLTVVDISNPLSPIIVGKIQDTTRFNTVSDVEAAGRYAFITSSYGFTVVDISDATDPVIISSLASANMSGGRAALTDQYAVTTGPNTLTSINLGCNPLTSDDAGSDGALDNSIPTSSVINDPLDDGLVAYWSFDEGTGTSVSDSSGSSTGTFVNTPKWTAGVKGTALNFNMDDRDAVQVNGAVSAMASSPNATIAGWINSNRRDTDFGNTISIGNILNLGIGGTTDNRARMGYYNGSAMTSIWEKTAPLAFNTGWHYYIATFDSTNDYFRLYIDGFLVGEEPYTSDVSWAGQTGTAFIGRSAGSQTTYDFDGSIDELRVYSRALGPNEVKRLYGRESGQSDRPDTARIEPSVDGYKGKISSGEESLGCGIKGDGSLWCWGTMDSFTYRADSPFRVHDIQNYLSSFYLSSGTWNDGYTLSATGSDLTVGAPALQTVSYYIYSNPIAGKFKRLDVSLTPSAGASILLNTSVFATRVDSNGKPLSPEYQIGSEINMSANNTAYKFGGPADLGNFSATDRIRFRITLRSTWILNASVTFKSPDSVFYATTENGGSSWSRVSVGANHVCGLRTGGAIWCWGQNNAGQLGNGQTWEPRFPWPAAPVTENGPWTKVDSGYQHTCALKADGTAWCWGYGVNGQLGIGTTPATGAPTEVSDTSLWSDISAGYSHSCGIKINGSAWCWGTDNYGELGDGTASVLRSSPVQVIDPGPWSSIVAGLNTTCGIKTDGSAWCWGRDNRGQLGDASNDAVNQDVPVPVGLSGPWTQLSAGGKSTTGSTNSYNTVCGIRFDGSAWCWGWGQAGQAGDGYTGTFIDSPVRVAGGGRWAAIDAGGQTSCGIKTDGTAWCWGSDAAGQAGNGTSASSNVLTPYPLAGFPSGAGWAYQDSPASIKALGNIALGTSYLTDSTGGTLRGLSYDGPGLAKLLQTSFANQLLLQSSYAVGTAQLSFKTDIGAAADVTSGLSAKWALNETSGTTASCTNILYNGTVSSTAKWITEGKSSGALSFNAAKGSNVTVSRNSGLEPTAFSWAFWMKTTGLQMDSAPIIAKVYANNSAPINYSYAVTLNGNSHHSLAFVTGYTGGNHTLEMKGSIPDESWVHVVVTYNPLSNTGQQKKLYINGVLNNSAAITNTVAYDTSSAGNLFFGYGGCASSNCAAFNGAIDDVRLYANKELTAAETSALYGSYQIQTARSMGVPYNADKFEIARNNTSVSNWMESIVSNMDFVLTNTGSVGLGTANPQAALDASGTTNNGAVRIGSDDVCNTNKTGTLRFTGGANPYEYCNGTSWTGFTKAKSYWKKNAPSLTTGTYSDSTCGIKANGSAWCWGKGTLGQLGNNQSTSDSLYPSSVMDSTGGSYWQDWIVISKGATQACGIRSDGTAWCWGSPENGVLGDGQATTLRLLPIQVQTDTGPGGWSDWISIATAEHHSCGIRSNGTAWCWGNGLSGQLGNNDNTSTLLRPVQVQSSTSTTGWTDWIFITAGETSSCGIRANGTAWCWGTTSEGSLGNNLSSTNANRPVQVQSNISTTGWADWVSLSISNLHVCGIRTNGTAWCWGSAGNGRLGDNQAATNRSRPVQVQSNISTTGWTDWISVSAGQSHTCGVRSNGTAWCWGSAAGGKLGDNQSTTDQYRPVQVQSDNSTTGWMDWTSISAGSTHSCGARSNGTLWCWGNAGNGKLGDGQNTTNRTRPVAVSD